MAEKRQMRNPATDQLFRAVLSLKDLDDCYVFFEDLCTMKELKDMAQRLEGARLLLENKTYDQIVKSVAISTATISRINRCIQYGTGGYQDMLERIGALEREADAVGEADLEERPSAGRDAGKASAQKDNGENQTAEKKSVGWKWNADCD